ncbi:hypothetical protein L1987_86986 [Smallanthus sonchifolius]|uniref:Uncharacterized protein n=1 Tax=Smallanthus sonchifolius TaxID=185202 RepID=A0ACB8Y535_9ASTR|nr:hypothetical protein L1987_86986 [Smallanthus sonchifolius]
MAVWLGVVGGVGVGVGGGGDRAGGGVVGWVGGVGWVPAVVAVIGWWRRDTQDDKIARHELNIYSTLFDMNAQCVWSARLKAYEKGGATCLHSIVLGSSASLIMLNH